MSVVCLEKFEEVRRGVGVLTARDVVERARATAARQAPRCAVLTCSDSRVAPELLTLSNLGEMFVTRVAGNVVDDLVLHSLKFAVENLGVRKIYVIGHKRCGAVAAALEGRAPPPIAQQIKEAAARAGSASPDAVETENVKITCEKLRGLGAEVEGYYYDLDAFELRRIC
ncbi:MAG: carbonic anhydrase [Pyrobaculum sp.]|jgi:carbonic anhydrase